MNKETDRKLKIENLERCLNCSLFAGCLEPKKEDIADCDHFSELSSAKQVLIIALAEYSEFKDRCAR